MSATPTKALRLSEQLTVKVIFAAQSFSRIVFWGLIALTIYYLVIP